LTAGWPARHGWRYPVHWEVDVFRWLTASVVVALVLAPPASADLFAPPAHFPAGDEPRALATGDFNHDGDRDIAVGNNGAGRLLLAGHGLSFGPPTLVLNFGGLAPDVAVADFNADGDQDLAFATFSGLMTVVRDNDGGFAPSVQDLPPLARGVAVGDFNRDGDPDLVVVREIGPLTGFAQPLVGAAGASFSLTNPATYGLPIAQRAVAVSDFDADGHQDVVAVTRDALTVLLGTGGGVFAAQPALPGGNELWSIATGDFNGDGDPDLALIDIFIGTLYVRLGGAGGTFGAPTGYSIGSTFVTGVASADFDADGDLDLAVTSEELDHVRVLLGEGDGTFAMTAQAFPVGLDPAGLEADDFDGDGRPDLAITNSASDSVSVLLNAAEPAIETDPSGLHFGTQAQATISAPRTITVHSTGERALEVERLRKIGPARDDFLVTTDTCTGATIAPGATCTVVVRFAPEATGDREANLQIDSDAPANPIFDLPLNGVGGALPTGPAGPAGPSGTDGTVGPAATARSLLATVFAADRHSARAGKRLRLRYVSTMDALVTIELRRGTRVVRRFTATAVAGRNTLTLRVPARRGRYTLALTAVASDQRVTDSARLNVTRRG
jgi:hypothetical protein